MSCVRGGDTGGDVIRRSIALFKLTDALALAASPTFAVMAVLTSTLGSDPAAVLCSAAHTSPLSGMTVMYLLMSALHIAPWARVLRARR
jgi:hypothetical protein